MHAICNTVRCKVIQTQRLLERCRKSSQRIPGKCAICYLLILFIFNWWLDFCRCMIPRSMTNRMERKGHALPHTPSPFPSDRGLPSLAFSFTSESRTLVLDKVSAPPSTASGWSLTNAASPLAAAFSRTPASCSSFSGLKPGCRANGIRGLSSLPAETLPVHKMRCNLHLHACPRERRVKRMSLPTASIMAA